MSQKKDPPKNVMDTIVFFLNIIFPGLVFQPASQVAKRRETSQPEASVGRGRWGADHAHPGHAGEPGDPRARPHPHPQAALQHGLQLHVSFHTSTNLNGRHI